MSREAHVPLVLWISTALLVHFAGGKSGMEAAQTVLDKRQLRALISAERSGLRPQDKVFEVMTPDFEAQPTDTKVAAPEQESEAADDKVDPDPDAPPDPERKAAKKDEDKPPEPPKEAAPKPPEPEKKPLVVVPVPPAPAPPPPPPDRRIAVMQHAEKDQPDNPTAQRVADDANHVTEERMAKIRAHDQDMANPNAGAQKKAGPKEEPGNSDQNKEAESEDRKGKDDKSPGEAAPSSTAANHSVPGAVQAPPNQGPKAAGGARAAGAPRGAGKAAEAETPPGSRGGAGPTSPEVVDAPKGGWSMDPANPGGDGSSRVAGRKRAGAPMETPVHASSMGLGSAGIPGAPNFNLTMPGVEQAVGQDKLRKERENDGASRRGEHAGRMKNNTNFQQYRAAIENYDPSVKLGDSTALNAARSPFATYLVTIHNKIHPFFADRELDSMDKTGDKAFADQNMYSVVELVLAPDTGRIIRRGIVKNSGSTAFDTISLKSVDSAAPFGKAPDAVVSPDGRVYLHWEFHRNHFDACATRGARPIIKKASAKALTPSPTGAPPKAPSKPSDESRSAPPGPLRPLRD